MKENQNQHEQKQAGRQASKRKKLMFRQRTREQSQLTIQIFAQFTLQKYIPHTYTQSDEQTRQCGKNCFNLKQKSE
jgi:Tat protein secretion system quality control protein TatD with DNase activity